MNSTINFLKFGRIQLLLRIKGTSHWTKWGNFNLKSKLILSSTKCRVNHLKILKYFWGSSNKRSMISKSKWSRSLRVRELWWRKWEILLVLKEITHLCFWTISIIGAACQIKWDHLMQVRVRQKFQNLQKMIMILRNKWSLWGIWSC